MKTRFYIVYCRDDAEESFPFTNLLEAQNKAYDMAKDNPGKRYFIMAPTEFYLGKVVMTIDGEECV